MLLRRVMATPATKNDVKNISDKLDKISKSLVDNSTSLLQLTEEIKEFRAVVLNRGGVKKILGGREPLHALQNRKFLNWNVSLSNVTPVLILRRYMLFGLVPEEMEVGLKYLEILQAELESACKHSGAHLRGLFSWHAKSL